MRVLSGRAILVVDLTRPHAEASGRSGKPQSYAFGYGYIKALIQAVNSEVQG